ncbi:hypothetical protein Anas_07050 [Armadillidium nasatum]|uniref:Uncharacterized protein n=1 Tax=Armadillidium nasatum TaxID=96803 RepID=A0A5N5SYS9_9CRUS|nr:hypothetical protein Anas_07050 [Armadillidium nasatum]
MFDLIINSSGDLVAELPFTLMHPKPEEEPELPTRASAQSSSAQDTNPSVDTNLIELDPDGTQVVSNPDDDIIFEDFARLRLKGEAES